MIIIFNHLSHHDRSLQHYLLTAKSTILHLFVDQNLDHIHLNTTTITPKDDRLTSIIKSTQSTTPSKLNRIIGKTTTVIAPIHHEKLVRPSQPTTTDTIHINKHPKPNSSHQERWRKRRQHADLQ